MKRVIKASNENSTLDYLRNKCKQFGYNVSDAFWDGSILIAYIKPDSSAYGGYLPDISYCRTGPLSSGQWKAETVSHGYLTADEYKKFTQAVDSAYQLLVMLNSFDFSGLDVVSD